MTNTLQFKIYKDSYNRYFLNKLIKFLLSFHRYPYNS
jgi:hypothetical protein